MLQSGTTGVESTRTGTVGGVLQRAQIDTQTVDADAGQMCVKDAGDGVMRHGTIARMCLFWPCERLGGLE